MTVSIVVFEINEIDGMRAMMPLIKKEWYDQLIVVDGGSTDGTLEYCRENGYDVFVQKDRGVGAALQEAFARCTGDIVIIYAPDGSFEPHQIPIIVEHIKNGVDIVNVSRYYGGTKSLDDTVYTAFGNWVFTKFANLFTSFRFTDFLYTYIGFKKELLLKLGVNENIITVMQIMMLRAIKRGYNLIEIPGVENQRIGGDVKVKKIRTAWIIFKTIIAEYFRR